jgi:hypothetical protein
MSHVACDVFAFANEISNRWLLQPGISPKTVRLYWKNHDKVKVLCRANLPLIPSLIVFERHLTKDIPTSCYA